jgi:MFS family permease
VSLFDDVGLSAMASIAISLFKLVATLVATFTVDQYGRKMLLYIGCSLMGLALLVLVGAFMLPYASAAECGEYTEESSCNEYCEWDTNVCVYETCLENGLLDSECSCCNTTGITPQKTIILVALFVYIGGYQVGFGPISWLIISEIFPLEVRGKAVSIAVVCNFFFNFVMTLIFPTELAVLGASATFLIYAVILASGVYFIFRFVPETKGLTLEEIEDFFIRSSKPREGGDGAAGAGAVGGFSYQQDNNPLRKDASSSSSSSTMQAVL